MNGLAQYFTDNVFSSLLVNSISEKSAKIIVDLGIGDGALTTAALKKWERAQFYGVDLDKRKIFFVNKKLPSVNLYNLNSLDINLNEKIKIKLGTVDVAICNPPYLNLEKDKKYEQILSKALLLKSVNLKRYTTDLIFLAQNINLLKQHGTLGIILPEGVICGHEYKLLREDLVTNHSVKMIIQLEPKIFKRTEAKTYIVILSKGRSSKEDAMLCFANENGRIEKKLLVNKFNLVSRMDYKFHSNKNQNKKGKTLKELGVTISRGSLPNHVLKNSGMTYFHSSDFKYFESSVNFEKGNLTNQNLVTARPGDILVGRVGRNISKQVLIVKRGEMILSDCVYKMECPKKYRQAIFKKLISENGRLYLSKISHGVCAQVISKRDLEAMRIQVPKV
jgi:type I restriction-modification system DNA methylase subunit